MKYLYRIAKIIIWGTYALVLMPLAFLFCNILSILWHMNFKHLQGIGWDDLSKWESCESDLVNVQGEWMAVTRDYYYSSPLALFLDRKTYTS